MKKRDAEQLKTLMTGIGYCWFWIGQCDRSRNWHSLMRDTERRAMKIIDGAIDPPKHRQAKRKVKRG